MTQLSRPITLPSIRTTPGGITTHLLVPPPPPWPHIYRTHHFISTTKSSTQRKALLVIMKVLNVSFAPKGSGTKKKILKKSSRLMCITSV